MADRFMEFVFPAFRKGLYQGDVAGLSAELFDGIEKFEPYLINAKPFFGGSDHPALGVYNLYLVN